MAVRYYDSAITEKIKNWIKDPKMVVYGPQDTNTMFVMRSDRANDEPVKLPLITIKRLGDYEIENVSKKATTYDGSHLWANKEQSQVLNFVPIKINYQLDIYTKYFEESDEYARNFIFKLINDPTVYINIPYNGCNQSHKSYIQLEKQIKDNSGIDDNVLKGQQAHRISIRFSIDGYIFSAPIMDNWNIEYDGDVKIVGEEGE